MLQKDGPMNSEPVVRATAASTSPKVLVNSTRLKVKTGVKAGEGEHEGCSICPQ